MKNKMEDIKDKVQKYFMRANSVNETGDICGIFNINIYYNHPDVEPGYFILATSVHNLRDEVIRSEKFVEYPMFEFNKSFTECVIKSLSWNYPDLKNTFVVE